MEQLLAAFVTHPTAIGFLTIIAAAFVYGTIKGTAAMTRGSDALVGIRADLAKTHEKDQASHEKTQKDVGEVRGHVADVKARVEGLEVKLGGQLLGVQTEVIKAVGADGALTRQDLADRRLSGMREAVEETGHEVRVALASSPVVEEPAPPPQRSRTGAGGRAVR